jgi:hypothetical protein
MGPGERSATSVSPRRRPMISSVSVVRAWKRHVSHTSSLILTEVRDISAAGRGRRRSAGVSGRPVAWWVRVSPLLSVPRTFLGTGTALRRVASRRLPWLLLRAWARDTLSGVGCGVRRPRGRAGSQETDVGPCCSSADRIKLDRPIEIFLLSWPVESTLWAT